MATARPHGPKKATILIIRHGEAPPKPPSHEKAEPGTFNADLTPIGRARANAYAAYFKDWFSLQQGGPPVQINRLFAADESSMSRRPILTLEPLAHELNLYIDHRFKDTHYAELANELQTNPVYTGDTILICWHHEHIYKLADALGMQAKPPWPAWPDGVYGWVAQLVYDENGQVKTCSYRKGEFMYDDAAT